MAGAKSLTFSLIVVVLIVMGVLDVVTDYEENQCEMTYMFERPEYLKIPMKKAVNKKFPSYGLYIYGEGNYARMISDMKLTGIPVLFIPGNAGSHKQVRSLGSIAYRRVGDKGKNYHFNYFSVSFNEEFSAIYGSLLEDQTEYVNIAIQKIFSLYKTAANPPKSIVLATHSMGGMVARALFTLPDFDPSQVHTIIMQATPNQVPALDSKLANFYKRVNSYWQDYGNTTLSNVAVVSIGGGWKDVQVGSGLTRLEGIVDNNNAVSTTTCAMPKSWVSTDHRCNVWCKQVVLAISRALMDIVDDSKKQISDDLEHRMTVFRHHLLQHPGSAGPVKSWPGEITLDKVTHWVVKKEKIWTYRADRVTSRTVFAIPVLEEEADHVVIVSNIPQDSWVCVCEMKEGEKQCSSCRDMSSTGQVIPPLYANKKVVSIDLNDPSMAKVTHVLIVASRTDDLVMIVSEMFPQGSRHLSNSLPGFMEIVLSFPESVTRGAMVLDLGTKASFYKLKLHGLNNVIKVYTARLETSQCALSRPGEYAGSVLHFHVPWNTEDTYKFIKYGESGSLKLKLQYAATEQVITYDPNDPMGFPGPSEQAPTDYVELLLHLDPSCHYKLRLLVPFTDMLGQFVRFYGSVMPAFCVASLLITLVHQLNTMAQEGTCPSVLDSIWVIKPYTVIPFTLILQAVLQMKVAKPFMDKLAIPDPDNVSLDQQGLWFRGAPLFLYLIACGITTLQAVVVNIIIHFKSRMLGLTFGWLPVPITKVLKLLALLLCLAGIGLSALVCGSVGIFVSYIICFVQVLKLCYRARLSGDPEDRSKFNFFMLLFMIWMWLVVLNIPPLLVWGKAIESTQSFQILRGDPSRLSGVVASITFLSLLIFNSPQAGRPAYSSIALYIRVMVILMLVFGVEMLYRVTYVILACLVAVAVPHILQAVRGTTKDVPREKTE